MLVKKKTVTNADIKFSGITLLSVEEAEQVPDDILRKTDYWWLRSPGVYEGDPTGKDTEYIKACVAVVGADGRISRTGTYITSDNCYGIRPALKLCKGSGLNPRDELELAGNRWTVIPGGYALMDDSIRTVKDSLFFRSTPRVLVPFRDCYIEGHEVVLNDQAGTRISFDDRPNSYEDSDIKRFVEEWAFASGICFEDVNDTP